jgi:multidrug resistance protein, MATE family
LDLDRGLSREVRRLAVPAIAQSLLQTMVFVVDRIMLGHHAEASLAAMQIAGPLEWSLWSIFSAFTVGTVARVGRHVGAEDRVGAGRAARASIAYAVGFGALVTLMTPAVVLGLGAAFPHASPATVDSARGYLAWTLAGSPLQFVAAAAIATLQASGDTRTPLAIGIGINVAHVGTNRILILGTPWTPALGMTGAGISTVFTFTLEAALACAVLLRSQGPVSLRRGALARRGDSREEGREVRRVALPALLERVLYHVGFLGFVWMVARLGDDVMAANQALVSVESVCFLSADGFGIAAAALVAQKLGAGRILEARRCATLSTRYAVALLTSLGLLFLATRWVVLPVFSGETRIIDLGATAVPVLAVAQPFMAAAVVLGQSLRGGGFTRAALGVTAVCALVVRLTCTYGLAIGLGLGLRGVWLGSTCDWVVRSVLFVVVGSFIAKRLRARASPAPS